MEIVVGCKVIWTRQTEYTNITIAENLTGIVKAIGFGIASVQQPGRTQVTHVPIAQLNRLVEEKSP